MNARTRRGTCAPGTLRIRPGARRAARARKALPAPAPAAPTRAEENALTTARARRRVSAPGTHTPRLPLHLCFRTATEEGPL